MNIRLYNAKICSMEDKQEITQGGQGVIQGEVWIEGERITFVGTLDEAKKQWNTRLELWELDKANHKKEMQIKQQYWHREIDCEGNLLMPGFKNAHTHSPMTFLRSYADDMPLQQWLNDKVFPMEAKLTEEDMYILTKLAIMEYLTSGITSCFDMYLKTEPRVKASLDCGFRMVICGSVNDFTGSIEQLEEEYASFHANSSPTAALVSYRLGFHAEYTTKRHLIEQIADLAQQYKAPVFMHLSETEKEVAECRKRYGVSPVEFLEKCGIFDFGGGGFHCVHVSQQDLEIMKERGLYVVSNPASNLKLASGIAPVEKMVEMGIPVALGTDGPASNNCLDMFREMYLVTALQKIYTNNAAALSADKVIKMAVTNGAYAMGLTDCDCLAPGKKADLILIDLHRPNMQPLNNLMKNLVYSGSKDNVKMTMINGRILYEDRRFHINTDTEEIYSKSNEIITRINHV